MNLQESITAAVIKLLRRQPDAVTEKPNTTLESIPPVKTQTVFDLYQLLSQDQNRIPKMDLATYYYENDSRVKSVINNLSRDVIKGGFKIVCRENAEAEDLANKMLDQTKLHKMLGELVKNWFLDGDLFIEHGVAQEDDGLSIVELKRRPAKFFYRLTNVVDEFTNPNFAFKWDLTSYSSGQFDTKDNFVPYGLWQINHARWDRIGFNKYGSPLLSAGNAIWKRIEQGENDMVTARATRAGIIRLHVLKGANPDELENYKEKNADALASAFAAVVNMFSNTETILQQEEGSMQLPPLNDIEHHLESWFAGSPIPMALIAYGNNISAELITLKEKQYRRSIETISDEIAEQVVMPSVRLQWLLNDIDPDDVKYEIGWKSKDPLSITDLTALADAILRFKASGVKKELIATFISTFIPNLDKNVIMTMIEDGMVNTGGNPNNPNSMTNVRTEKGEKEDSSGNKISTGRLKSTKDKLGADLSKE